MFMVNRKNLRYSLSVFIMLSKCTFCFIILSMVMAHQGYCRGKARPSIEARPSYLDRLPAELYRNVFLSMQKQDGSMEATKALLAFSKTNSRSFEIAKALASRAEFEIKLGHWKDFNSDEFKALKEFKALFTGDGIFSKAKNLNLSSYDLYPKKSLLSFLPQTLTRLDYSHRRIKLEDANALLSFTSLRELNIENLDELNRKLNMRFNIRWRGFLPEFLSALSSLPLLETLNVNYNELDAEAAKALLPLKSLKSLQIASNRLGDEGARVVSSLTSLKSLQISSNKLSDGGADALSSLTSLETLDVSENKICWGGAKALLSIPSLKALQIRFNKLGDKGAKTLSSLTGLKALDISANKITDDGAEALSSLTSLRTLYINYNNLSERGATALSFLTSLTTLHINFNPIGDEGVKSLCSLGSLRTLNLYDTRLSSEGVKVLASLTTLKSLDIEGNIAVHSTRSDMPPSVRVRMDRRYSRKNDAGTGLWAIRLHNWEFGKRYEPDEPLFFPRCNDTPSDPPVVFLDGGMLFVHFED